MGKNTLIALCVAAGALGACAQNDTRPTAALAPNIAPESTRMAEATVTMPPSGYLDYCMRNPAECPSGVRGATQPELLTPARWAELDHVNAMVNASVRYVTDASLYNRQEYWTHPNGRGDCEDYVLAKRKMLLDRGWRAETLLIGVALDLEGLRHAVLIAATDKGDFVLDNQLERVVAWQETGYAWEKRQTAANANIWVALTGGSAEPAPLEPAVIEPTIVASSSELSTAAPAPNETRPEGQPGEATLIEVASLAPEADETSTAIRVKTAPIPRLRPSSVVAVRVGITSVEKDTGSASAAKDANA